MKAEYKFLDHTADVLFHATGPTLEELFAQCGLALEDTQVHLEKVEAKEMVELQAKGSDPERLLFDFLDDLLLEKDANLLIFSKFEIRITQQGKWWEMDAKCWGEKLDVEKHEPKVDVKAITFHMFEVKKKDDGWFAQVLVDI